VAYLVNLPGVRKDKKPVEKARRWFQDVVNYALWHKEEREEEEEGGGGGAGRGDGGRAPGLTPR
jgi:hypothetical protein